MSRAVLQQPGVFSDYYLNVRLPIWPEWQEDVRQPYQSLRALYSDVRQRYAGQSEGELRSLVF